MTKKHDYLDQYKKSSAAAQFQDRPIFNKFWKTNNQQVELQNKQRHLQDQQSSITKSNYRQDYKTMWGRQWD